MFNLLKSKSQTPKSLGQLGEELAQIEYKNRGYKIVAANFFNKKGKRLGELDFVAINNGQIIFVEVKTRSQEKSYFGSAAESVNYFKQQKLLKAVKIFLLANQKYINLKPQIDVCVIIIKDFSQFEVLQENNQTKYLPKLPLDKLLYSVTIIPDAVEDYSKMHRFHG